MNIAAVITAFNPTTRLLGSIDSLMKNVDSVIIVNNGDRNDSVLSSIKEQYSNSFVNIIDLPSNMGVASALNIGTEMARKDFSPDFILTLDQDTVLEINEIKNLVYEASQRFPNFGIFVLSESTVNTDELFSKTEGSITSGNIVRAEVLNKISYREEFFIDSIDGDFCYRVLHSGYDIVRYNRKAMTHELGQIKEKIRYEPSFRLYYIARNSTVLFLERKTRFWLYSYQIATLLFRLTLVGGGPKGLAAVLEGFFDGITGKLGKNVKYLPGSQ
ncbi:MAG: glycosyltransferase [Thermoplasmatales archaeon]|jgi:rhamnosyltransferase|nr:glycosyltransferase [Candidatus Thermoplasmatota archaeon]MDA8055893.1 glycosyltransferase [Thermoplasmatales archaeon]